MKAVKSTSGAYLNVVDTVVNTLRQTFVDDSGDNVALDQLRMLWELKMMQCGVIQGPMENSTSRGGFPTPVHDLNVPYEGTEEYQTPTAEMLFPPTPLQMSISTPSPAESGQSQYFPIDQRRNAKMPDTATNLKMRRPVPYTQQRCPWMNHKLPTAEINVAYEEAHDERGRISEPQAPTKDLLMMPPGKRKLEECPPHLSPCENIPQQDGSRDMFLLTSLHHKEIESNQDIGKRKKLKSSREVRKNGNFLPGQKNVLV